LTLFPNEQRDVNYCERLGAVLQSLIEQLGDEVLQMRFNSSAQDCPLTWNGITVYGAIDIGVDYMTHGAPFNGAYPQGVEALIAKNSQGAGYSIAPNGLGRSAVGLKGREEFAPDWSFVFKVETGFDPYSLQLANGPRSLVENNSNILANQSANGDSSRAGQIMAA